MLTINELRQGYNQLDNKSGRLEKPHTLFHPMGGVIQEYTFSYSLGKNVYLYKFRNYDDYVIIIDEKDIPHHKVIEDHTTIVPIAEFMHKYGNITNYVLQKYDRDRLVKLVSHDLAIQKKYVYPNTNIRIKNLFFGKHWNISEKTDGSYEFKCDKYKNTFHLDFCNKSTFTKEDVIEMINKSICE